MYTPMSPPSQLALSLLCQLLRTCIKLGTSLDGLCRPSSSLRLVSTRAFFATADSSGSCWTCGASPRPRIVLVLTSSSDGTHTTSGDSFNFVFPPPEPLPLPRRIISSFDSMILGDCFGAGVGFAFFLIHGGSRLCPAWRTWRRPTVSAAA